MVSRLTSDIDAIMELLANGFDSLVTAVLTMVGVGVLLLVLDFELGAVCLLCFPVLMLLVRWFSRASSRTYRKVRETSALTIVQFIETMTGIKAVQAYRRERRNSSEVNWLIPVVEAYSWPIWYCTNLGSHPSSSRCVA